MVGWMKREWLGPEKVHSKREEPLLGRGGWDSAPSSRWAGPGSGGVPLHFQSPFLLPPGGTDGKASAYNAGDPGSIPGSGRSPGERHGYPLQYFCLENSMDRAAWQATPHRVTNSRPQLSNQHAITSKAC